MFSAKSKLELYEHRMEMCKICMEPESTPNCTVRVLPLEKLAYEHFNRPIDGDTQAPPYRVGTADILELIESKYGSKQGYELHLVLGSDTYRDLSAKNWKKSDR